MQLTGLSLFELVSVLALGSAITLALYLLKLRRERVRVSYLPLWESLLADRQASQLFRRLQHVASLLIALAIVALLSFAWSDPRNVAAERGARHLLVLIDTGISMRAHDVKPSRLELARREALRVAREAAPGTRIMLAQFDRGVTPLCGFGSDPRDAERALERLEASELASDLAAGYRFAHDALRGRSGAELVVISDSAEEPAPELAQDFARAKIGFRRIAIGRRSDDVGISAFALRRYPLDRNRSELLIELYSASPHPESVELSLLGDGSPIDVQPLTLEPFAVTRRIYDDVTGVGRTLEARLRVAGDHDDLGPNDRAFAVVPEKHRVRVLCVSAGDRYLEASLLLDEYLDVDMIAPSRYTTSAGYDVVIFDRFVPPAAAQTPALFLAPNGTGPAQPFAVDGVIDHPAFERVERNHPLLRFAALRDVNVVSALHVRTDPRDQVLAADARGALIVAGERNGQPFVALNFGLQASDLPLRVAWPLLLLNTIDWFTHASNEYVPAATVGRPTRIELPHGVATIELSAPGGAKRSLASEGDAVWFTPERAGFYRATWPGGEHMLAANLDPENRRDLSPAKASARTPAGTAHPTRNSAWFGRPLWSLLLFAVLLLLLIEWLSYHRRMTV